VANLLGHVGADRVGESIPGGTSRTGLRVKLCDNVVVPDKLWWEATDAAYIRGRSDRYPGAVDVEPEWTLEAADDPRRILRNPDPVSRTGAIRLIGYSPTAGFVVTVIIDPTDWAGITAWKTRGADLRSYLEGKEATT
jgi:hypothetical protein